MDYSLTYFDILSIRANEWFHYNVLNAFFNLLDCKYRVTREDYAILNIHIYHLLTTGGYNFNNITRLVPRLNSAEYVMYPSYSYVSEYKFVETTIYLPILLNGEHWILCSIDLTNVPAVTITIYDSKMDYLNLSIEVFQNLSLFTNNVLETKGTHPIHDNLPINYSCEGVPTDDLRIIHETGVTKVLQKNDDDCGAWVVVFLNLLLEGQADKIKNLSQSFLTTFQVREQIAIFVLRGSLDDYPHLW